MYIKVRMKAVMSTGRVGSQFWDVSNSTGRSCQCVVTRPILDRSSYSGVVTQPISRSVRLQHQPNPTDSGSSLNIIKPDLTDLSYNVTGILIATQFVINYPLHRIM